MVFAEAMLIVVVGAVLVLMYNHLNHLVYKQLVHLNKMNMEFDIVVVVVVLLAVTLSV